MAYQEKNIGGNGHVAIHDWDPVDEKGHHKNSTIIQHDIDETRSTMDSILDILSGRFHPQSLVDRAMGYFQQSQNREKIKDSFLSVGNRIGDSFSRNPLPAMMIGAGAVWMLWESQKKEHTTAYEEYDYDESTGGVKENAEAKMGDIKSKAKGSFEKAKERVGSGINKFKEQREDAMERSGQMKEKARDRYQQGIQSGNQFARDNPLAIGFASLAIGIVAGLLLPETREEKRTLGPKSKEAMDTVREKGESLYDEGKGVVSDLKEKTENVVREEGLAPDQLKSRAERSDAEKRNSDQQTEREPLASNQPGTQIENVSRVSINESDAKLREKKNPGK